jgi:hypothetical protein
VHSNHREFCIRSAGLNSVAILKRDPTLSPLLIREQPQLERGGTDTLVESRMGAVAFAMRQRSVSHPRSSNRRLSDWLRREAHGTNH